MRSSSEWRDHYDWNARNLLAIPWEAGADWSDEERRAIAASVQGFQAGESSEGLHLFHAAERHAERTGDHAYVAAIRLFIAEEQRHARELARVLKLNGVPLLRTTFPDRVFRGMRHLFSGLETSIGVLITAEIIAKVYYAALRDATNSAPLRALCDQILLDEKQHVDFQAEQLAKLRWRRGWPGMAGTMGAQRFLFWGTCFVVWWCHGKAIRKGGYSFSRYWRACWTEFEAAFATAAAGVATLRADAAAPAGPGVSSAPERSSP